MILGVVGAGTVGRALARSFVEHVDEIRVYDVMPERSTHTLADVLESSPVFCCLPTPQKSTGYGLDLKAIWNFFGDVMATHSKACFVLKSTVPIGTTNKLRQYGNFINLVFSPEFLTARCAMTDAQMPARNIIGGVTCETTEILTALYTKRFPGVPIMHMTSCESEAVKLFQNGFFATKVSYWNECRELSDKLGLDWEKVIAGILADGRISHSHTTVPGPDGLFGWGGACLGKDLSCLVEHINSAGLVPSITRAVNHRNQRDRKRTA